jgi:hypothetical protein
MTQPANSLSRFHLTATEKFCCCAVLSGTLIFYWSTLWTQPINAAHADEFVDVLWFIEIFLSRAHWQEWWAVIALPNHEHVTIFNHVVYLIDYALFKKIHFLHYVWVGNAIVLACCWVLADWLRRWCGGWYASAIAVGLFLNLFYWDASFWAMTALSNQAVILFALLAARSATNNPRAIVTPVLWSLLAIASQFNGLLVLPALMVGSVFSAWAKKEKNNWLQLQIWSAAFVLTTALYCWYENPFAADHLWRYVQYTDPAHLQAYIKPSYGAPVSTAEYLLRIPLTFLTSAGASVFYTQHGLLPALLGVIVLMALAYCAVKREVATDSFWWSVLAFVVVSLLLVAIGRGAAFGAEAVLASRYRLYSFLLLVLLAGCVLQKKSTTTLRCVVLCCGVIVQVISLTTMAAIKRDIGNVQQSYYYWLIDGGMGRTQMPFYPHNQDARLFNAYREGYYNPYDAIAVSNKPKVVETIDNSMCTHAADSVATVLSPDMPTLVQAYSKKAKALAVELRWHIPVMPTDAEFLFCGTSAYRVILGEKNIDQKTQQYFPILILKNQLPPSEYRVYAVRDGNSAAWLGNIRFP